MKKITQAVLLAALAFVFSAAAKLTPVELRCDYTVNPLGVDSQNPRLFWNLNGDEREQLKTAYQ